MFARHLPVVFATLLAMSACQASQPHPAQPGVVATVPTDKPSAPVKVVLEAKPLGGNAYSVTLTAIPTIAVPSIELEIDGRRAVVGLTPAEQPRTFVARVELDGTSGREIVGSATVPMGNSNRRAAAVIQVGEVAAQPAPAIQVVQLPDGTEAAEVRQ